MHLLRSELGCQRACYSTSSLKLSGFYETRDSGREQQEEKRNDGSQAA